MLKREVLSVVSATGGRELVVDSGEVGEREEFELDFAALFSWSFFNRSLNEPITIALAGVEVLVLGVAEAVDTADGSSTVWGVFVSRTSDQEDFISGLASTGVLVAGGGDGGRSEIVSTCVLMIGGGIEAVGSVGSLAVGNGTGTISSGDGSSISTGGLVVGTGLEISIGVPVVGSRFSMLNSVSEEIKHK